jgi:prepilin-type N-terminal cleavage/methylation domain-containing protein
MKRKLNKKGFTLVEIIGVVAILGIVSVVGIVSVNSIIKKGKQEHYVAAEKNLKITAESYAQANREYLPKNVGDMKKIPLRTLVENNYMEQIKDYHDKNCDLDNSYVQIFKYSKDGYSYLAYLDCPDYKNTEHNNSLKPTISITMTDDTNNVKKTTSTVKITDTNKILSYSISVYKYDEEIYSSGNVEASYATVVDKVVDISSYTPGKLKTVVKATNIYGQSTTETLTKEYKDRKKPKCEIKTEDSSRGNDDWIAADRKITVGCDDGEEGSGCERDEYTKVFKEDAKTGTITIKDKAGNTTDCTVDVYIDKTKPSCEVNDSGTKGDNNWYITNSTIKLTESDNLSGIKYRSLQKTSTLGSYNGIGKDTQYETKGQTWYGFVEDYAGNKESCTGKNVKVDTTAPTTPSGGSIAVSGSSKDAEVGAVSGSTDATSGLKEYRYYIKNSYSTPANTDSKFTTSRAFTRSCGTSYYAYAIAIDNAGNRSVVHYIGGASDGKDEYSDWGDCSAACNGGTQTRTNTCALVTTGLSQSCNTMDCCSSTSGTWTSWTSCSKACGGGTKTREKDLYSDYDGRYCDTEYDSKQCNTDDCCSSTWTDWDSWGACDADCGTGTKYRSGTIYSDYDNSFCGYNSDSTSCNAGSCEPPAHDHDWNCRPASTHSVTWSNCTAGHSKHTTGFKILCCICGTHKTYSATLWCPNNTSPRVV